MRKSGKPDLLARRSNLRGARLLRSARNDAAQIFPFSRL
jgi:hypothetical protein